jgi:hypothetical protein
MAHFLPSRYKFLLSITRVAVQVLSKPRNYHRLLILMAGTGAVSRYKASSEPENCQGILEFNCEQMRVSGCKNQYESVLGAGTKAKSVTNPLIIPSVLAHVIILRLS